MHGALCREKWCGCAMSLQRKYRGTAPRFLKYRNRPDDPYMLLRVNLPKWMYMKLREVEKNLKIPIGRMISYAVFNELFEAENPFELTLPVGPAWRPGVYEEEAKKLYTFMSRFPTGIGIDVCYLMCEEIGIDPKLIQCALMELQHNHLVQMVKPKDSSYKFSDGYYVYKTLAVDIRTKEQNRYKTFEGRSTSYKAKEYAERFKKKQKGVL